MQLSNGTMAALIEVLEKAYSHSQLSVLRMQLEIADDPFDDERKLNKLDRSRLIVEGLRDRDEEPDVITLVRELIEVKYKNNLLEYDGRVRSHLTRLVESLEKDGYVIVDGRLVATTPDPAALAPQMSMLEHALRERGFDVALRHYQQAVECFVDGRLEASNGQLRSFLDDLAISLCKVIGETAKDAKAAADVLRNKKKIDGDEAKLLGGLAGVSNERGAHAGLTDPEEALFRMHMTTATARYLLARIAPTRKRKRRASPTRQR